ncbi:hypothetical protein GLE_3320 [Lysobacter enzymogenes]|uniref:Uncharacterized protein n=1 Tax=Lysobacter enzymogenes TaxID=69 RepID=A0A0S2DJE3_LYSEN|nr:hypothetical protein [Lysobacter enzymogenes]ALN58666.1 hypothetical protein GLE_3320 [Lysobacter enzymogenes]QCW26986.1 hypothetical protein FE772_16420 [Lysobacter enzymogenes]UZW62561.1 hypothetical protein BV903_009835 [Lysobacter enzymogenes]
MSKKINKPVALALGATLLGGLSLSASAFAMSDLSQGYMLGAQQAQTAEKAADAKATDAKKAEGSCGAKKAEGSCGGDKKKAEGSCGGDKKKAEGSCGGDKKKADAKGKKAGEGKCGEGKCGGSI